MHEGQIMINVYVGKDKLNLHLHFKIKWSKDLISTFFKIIFLQFDLLVKITKMHLFLNCHKFFIDCFFLKLSFCSLI